MLFWPVSALLLNGFQRFFLGGGEGKVELISHDCRAYYDLPEKFLLVSLSIPVLDTYTEPLACSTWSSALDLFGVRAWILQMAGFLSNVSSVEHILKSRSCI